MSKKIVTAFFILLSLLFILNSPGCVSRKEEPAKKEAHPGPLDVSKTLAGSEPVFVSDYFSFVGSDEKGRVAFAIDSDRSRRDGRFESDAHVVLRDEHEGWIKVSGSGRYENRKKELLRIPDSPAFQFTGDAKNGITLASPVNRLVFAAAPLNERFFRADDEMIFSMGSTSATLMWRGRVIPGRVIYEYIFMKNLSPWYSFFSGLFYNDFQGLYLKTDEGGDFYLRSSKSGSRFGSLENLIGTAAGFEVLDGATETLEELRAEVTERSPGLGLYRWPKSWRITWRGQKGAGVLTVTTVDRKTVTNWLIGGFAMSAVTGELIYDGKTRHVYGLAELIR